MTDAQIPKFKFDRVELASDEEVEKLNEEQSSGKFFTPGNYDVKIAKIEYNGLSEKDTSWFGLKILLKNAANKEITHFVLVPTRGIKFGVDGTVFVYRKLKEIVCERLDVV